MSSNQPVLLVDVDGVLNALGGFGGPPPGPFEQVFQANGASGREIASGENRLYTIRVPLGTSKRLAYLDKLFECVWCTTWEHVAIRELAPQLGVGANWPVCPVISERTHTLPTGQMTQRWKLPVIWRWIEEHYNDRKVAWIDDDQRSDWSEDLSHDIQWWIDSRTAATLCVTTNDFYGMSKADVRSLKEFACG